LQFVAIVTVLAIVAIFAAVAVLAVVAFTVGRPDFLFDFELSTIDHH
jgi:hypothetical protein